jgi:RNA polymerase sigma factor for flagellar operon FliA
MKIGRTRAAEGLPRALVDRYTGIVRRHAFRLARRLPAHIRVEDLIAAGFFGLADALRKYDGVHADRFHAYADARIRGAMLDELRSCDPLSRDMRDLNKRIVAAIRVLTGSLNRPPDELEIAQHLGIPVNTLRGNLAHLSNLRFVNVDTCSGDGTEGIDIADDRAESAEATVYRSERQEKLASVVADLPERLQQVLNLYYVQDFTMREIGIELGLTESRVCQLHGEAILRLRAGYMATDDHDEVLTSVRRLRLPAGMRDESDEVTRRAG